MFHPKHKVFEERDDYSKFDSKIQFVIEDRTQGKHQYKVRFTCGNDYVLEWNTEFDYMDETVAYDSTMKKTKCIDLSKIKTQEDWPWEDNIRFQIKAELTVKSKEDISRSLNSSALQPNITWPTEDDNEQFETSSILEQVIAPTSIRSPAFMTCINKIVVETKDDSLSDLVLLASKLLELAKTFDLPDLEKISSGFLDFQISNHNFADILEMAIDQKIAALLNSAAEFITKNQKELRGTNQWDKMKACPVMMLSLLDKLFEKTI